MLPILAQYLEQGVLCVEVLRHRHSDLLMCDVRLHEPKWKDGSDVAGEERCELERCLQVPSAWKRDTNSAVAAA